MSSSLKENEEENEDAKKSAMRVNAIAFAVGLASAFALFGVFAATAGSVWANWRRRARFRRRLSHRHGIELTRRSPTEISFVWKQL